MASNDWTREQWLEAAVSLLMPLFHKIDVELPKVRVSVGWPSKGGLAGKGKVIGQCWSTGSSIDGVSQIYISPTLGDDVVQVLEVLVHELIHAWDNCKHDHKGPFAAKMRAIGMTGKMTQSTAGEDLRAELKRITEVLGEFPHSALIASEMEKERKKQTTRMIKLVASGCDCGYTVRTTRKWIEEGLPSCPHGATMEEA